ncbi:MAG: vitamin K epoxide reductase family protein [Lapillicoccus sp.]
MSGLRGVGAPASTRARVLPSWFVPTALGLSVIGTLLAAYLTFEHFTQNATLACSTTATINCQKVTESQWSSFLGIPVALLGLGFFLSMVVLCSPRLMRAPGRRWDALRLAWCGIGLVFALYLVFAELYHIHAICLWCTGVHVVTLLLLITLVFGTLLIEPAEPEVSG